MKKFKELGSYLPPERILFSFEVLKQFRKFSGHFALIACFLEVLGNEFFKCASLVNLCLEKLS